MTATEVTVDLTPLYSRVLKNFAAELHDAGALQLDHLARMAEGDYSSPVGQQMRDLVDDERTRRAFNLTVTAVPPLDDVPQAGPRRAGTDSWAIRQERWKQAGKVGHPGDPEYDDFFYQGRDGAEDGAQ